MIEVKFHKGIAKKYEVTRENFIEATNEKHPYCQKNGDKKEAYGICPLCENPVKLLGVYTKLEKQRSHARHCKNDVNGIANFNEYVYLRCPYHRQRADYVIEAKEPKDMTNFNREILQLAHDNFHICLYIIRKVTGLVISDSLAKEIAMDYMSHPGYMTYDITKENIPYIMALCMTGKNLIKRVIEEDSPLYNMLKDKKEVSLVLLTNSNNKKGKPLYRIESNVGYLKLMFCISNYRFVSGSTSKLQEYLKVHIGVPDGMGTYDTYAQKEIEVDPFLFTKLILSQNSLKPRKELIDIADKVLVLR